MNDRLLMDNAEEFWLEPVYGLVLACGVGEYSKELVDGRATTLVS